MTRTPLAPFPSPADCAARAHVELVAKYREVHQKIAEALPSKGGWEVTLEIEAPLPFKVEDLLRRRLDDAGWILAPIPTSRGQYEGTCVLVIRPKDMPIINLEAAVDAVDAPSVTD